jgi:pectin methylesterase-like acyl-CoA thioesterase
VAHRRQQFLGALACLCAVMPALPNSAHASDYFVNPSGANGAFPTVQSAVNAVVGQTETNRANIFVAPARYVERVTVDKPFVTLIGQGAVPTDVVISFNRTYVFNSPGETVAIRDSATAFMARNLTFENSTVDHNVIQALAVTSYADRAIFDSVRFLGYQDTLWVHGRARQYFRGSFITGDTDFIFGDATALFDRCTIESTDGGWITAADTARITANGFIFLDCSLVRGTDRSPLDDGTAAPNNSVFLGRPWIWDAPNQMASVTFIRTRMGPQIAQAGWDPWNAIIDPHPSTRISEWGSMNLAGQLLADTNHDGTPDGRLSWADHLTEAQAANYTIQNIFGPVEFWNATMQPETSGIPYLSQGDPWNPHVQLLSLPARPGAQPQLFNISTRLHVGIDEAVGVGGFIITGPAPKKVILRALGPSLQGSGLVNALTDSILNLHDARQLVASNDNWRDDEASAAELTTIGLAPAHDAESAIVITLLPGRYTAVMSGKNGTTGMALVEVYDGDLAADSHLANISTRGFVGTADAVLIGGFIVGGNGRANGRVVIRAIGPSLAAVGIEGALPDPALTLKNANGSTVLSNDDWQESQVTELTQTGLAPTDFRESTLVTALSDGNYTAIISGKGSATGIAVVEVYIVP